MHFFDAFNFGSIPYAQLSLMVWLLIGLALVFDFLNGMNDAANSIATVVSTRVLSPRLAVAWAAFFNFIAFLVFHLTVANTIAKIIHPPYIDDAVIGATLVGGCFWTYGCTRYGLPISVSHSLIGGMMGAALVKAGVVSLNWTAIAWTVVFIVLSPLIGLVLGLAVAVAVAWIFRGARPRQVDTLFRRGQLLSAALYSLGHGGGDAQKTMGIIGALLIGAGVLQVDPATGDPVKFPTEVVLACHTAIALGTLLGGWAVIKTLGHNLMRLRPVDGFCAETGAAATLVMTIFAGIPVSTTHTITGAIVGVGSLKRLSAVRWGVAGRVVWAWVLTIPGSALVAMLTWGVWQGLSWLFGGG